MIPEASYAEQNPVKESTDPVWKRIQREALEVFEGEPYLRRLIDDVILSKETLEDSICARLSRKFGRIAGTEEEIMMTFREAFDADPEIAVRVRADIEAIYERDPACEDYLSPLLFLKGFQAMTAYRISHLFWKQDRKHLALYLQSQIAETFGVDIHPAARFGKGIFLDHATSFVAGETAVVADNVSILHEVTLGGTGKDKGDRHPKIQSGVLLSSGSKILGNITIGAFSKVGANSVVLQDVPAHVTVAGVPAKIVAHHQQEDCPATAMDQCIDD
ncbi:MAG: serine O-acetyltransferase [Verrucomicrobiota bacterium]